MASKRMINISVIDSDAFLSLPQTAQNLYFHLNMRADDDGFVDSPKKIMRIVGANDGDMQQLLQKRYLLIFESGVIVIKHWRMHNTIQSDRKIPTNYQEELSELTLQENKTYTEKNNPKFITNKKEVKDTYSEFKNVKLLKSEYDKLVSKLGEKTTKDLIERLGGYIAQKGTRYKSHYATILNWHRRDKDKAPQVPDYMKDYNYEEPQKEEVEYEFSEKDLDFN